MTENDYCGILFTKARWAYPVLARMAPLLVWLGILEPTDYKLIAQNNARVDAVINAQYVGIAAHKKGLEISLNPYLKDTSKYKAWLRGYEYSVNNPKCEIPRMEGDVGAATFLNDVE